VEPGPDEQWRPSRQEPQKPTLVSVFEQVEEIFQTEATKDQPDQVCPDGQQNMSEQEFQGTPNPMGVRTSNITWPGGSYRDCPSFNMSERCVGMSDQAGQQATKPLMCLDGAT
jgi:hypothetical protein